MLTSDLWGSTFARVGSVLVVVQFVTAQQGRPSTWHVSAGKRGVVASRLVVAGLA